MDNERIINKILVEKAKNDILYSKKIKLLIDKINEYLNEFVNIESRLMAKGLISTFEIFIKCLIDMEKEVE